MRVLKRPPFSEVKQIAEITVNLTYSDGQGFKKPEKDRGYYLSSYDEMVMDEDLKGSDYSDICGSIYMRILPDITERTPENDAKAKQVLSQVKTEIYNVFEQIRKTQSKNTGGRVE